MWDCEPPTFHFEPSWCPEWDFVVLGSFAGDIDDDAVDRPAEGEWRDIDIRCRRSGVLAHVKPSSMLMVIGIV